MHSLRSIAERWKELEAVAVPKKANELQRKMMREMFYAGCASFYEAVIELAAFDEEAGEAILTMFRAELQDFAANEIAAAAVQGHGVIILPPGAKS